MLNTGSVIAGKYRLEAMFARGGMGSVWRARHVSLDTEMAVKLMDPSIAASGPERARFAAEAKAAAKLKSQHIVQVTDYGVEEETPYIVMELLEGEDLGARLRREGRQSLEMARTLNAQVARGLRRAHEAGVIHRDLKPANIFLARGEEGEEVAKILDFGIARFAARTAATEMTKTGTLLGSPPYMSPEQVRGLRDLDHRTDLWSFGIILFRVVTGSLPFQSDQVGDLIFKICADAAPPPSSLVAGLPPDLDRFFERALAKSPAARYSTAIEMAEAFSAACGFGGRAPLVSLADSSAELDRAPIASARAADPATVMARGAGAATVPVATPPPGNNFGKTTLPLEGPWRMPVVAPTAAPGLPSPRVPSPPAGGVTTQLTAPNLNALSPVATPQAIRPPHAPAPTVPLPDGGTLTANGRTLASAGSAAGGSWWKIGLLVLAGLVVMGVVIREVVTSRQATSENEPAPIPVVFGSTSESPLGSTGNGAPNPGVGLTTTDPGATTGSPAVVDPAATGEVGGTTEPTATAASLAAMSGKLSVNSIPVSRVVVDGRPLGNTPRVGLVLPPGKHTVTLVNPQTGERHTQTVNIKPGQTEKVTKRFD